jgi:hypothetical protein
MIQIVVDEEFKHLISPLTSDELEGLEVSIKSEGCRDPLTLWERTLIDGHNRYEICTRLGVQYQTRSISLPDRDSAIEWIINNQLSRRNLPLYQRASLVLKRDAIIKARAKERMLAGKADPEHQGAQGCGDRRTDTELGKMAGTSHKTIHQVRVIEREATPEAKEKLAQGKTTIRREYLKIRKPESKPSLTKNERIGVIRELSDQGYKADQIAPRIGISEEHTRKLARDSGIELADVLLSNRRKIDVNRIVAETVIQAQSLTSGLDLIESRLTDLDQSKIHEWVLVIGSTVTALNRLIKTLKRSVNEQQDGREISVAS